jgi:hypothetical protein
MTEQQVNEYMGNLLEGKIPAPKGIEGDALNQFRAITGELTQTDQRLRVARRDVEQLGDKLKQLIGQRTAYANILIMAETARRQPAGDDKPLDLEGLRKKLRADKVEASDNEGNVIESAGERNTNAADPPAAQ